MLEWSVDVLVGRCATHVVVALPPGVDAPAGTIGVVGGAERSLSVRNALQAARRRSRCSSTTRRARC